MAIYDTEAAPAQILRSSVVHRLRDWRLCGEGHREPERTACPRLTLHPDLAPHQLRELFADGEPQPRAAILARGRTVGLTEGLEQAPLRLKGQADASVLDLKPHRDRVVGGARQRHREHDFAPSRKLKGIRQEVQQNLAQPPWIPPESGWDVRVDQTGQVHPLVGGGLGRQIQRFIDRGAQVKVDDF